jgi:hypothetical protein
MIVRIRAVTSIPLFRGGKKMADDGSFKSGDWVKLRGFKDSPEMMVLRSVPWTDVNEGVAIYRCLWANANGAGTVDVPATVLIKIGELSRAI